MGSMTIAALQPKRLTVKVKQALQLRFNIGNLFFINEKIDFKINSFTFLKI